MILRLTLLSFMTALPLLMAAPASAQDVGLRTHPASYPVAYKRSGGYQANLARIEKAPWSALDNNEKALRMNRDYDYPFARSSASTIVLPPSKQQIKRWQRHQIKMQQQADANFKAMSADERRAFLQANRAAFRAGLNPRPVYRY